LQGNGLIQQKALCMMAQAQKFTGEPVGQSATLAHFHGAMLRGVAGSNSGRIFVNFPEWGDDVQFTVAALRNGEAVAYPSQSSNDTDPNDPAAARRVQLAIEGIFTSIDVCSPAKWQFPSGSRSTPRTPYAVRSSKTSTSRWCGGRVAPHRATPSRSMSWGMAQPMQHDLRM
jgi:hypothetical protein